MRKLGPLVGYLSLFALNCLAPAAGTDNLLVTHKPNIADAFGKEFADVKEAETLIYRPNPAGPPTLVARVQASEWIAAAAAPARRARKCDLPAVA